ncbi:MAG: tagaturonate epimerase family protein [Planctomycetota bacterium]
MLTLPRFTFGVGDRFAHQAEAQLAAFERLAADGVVVSPVWNKSNREHTFIGSEPASVRAAASAAVAARKWPHSWFVDADHIRLETVDRFLDSSDFFTIDVADSIGKPAGEAEVAAFLAKHAELTASLTIPGIAAPVPLSVETSGRVARSYLLACREAGEIFRHIGAKRGDRVAIEVSMDETDAAQTPPELLVILALLADEGVPLQTIAPKFTGRFNKGVDYVGDLTGFEKEFSDDVAVLAYAADRYGLPKNLKLSVHSGSDKFSLYSIIRRIVERTGAGLHLKTAGTTWLEEMIGLAEAGGDGLVLAKEIYAYAYDHVEEFCAPYATVIDIDRAKLPPPATVASWNGPQLAAALRHVPANPAFNPHMRQLVHVSFKVAAKQGKRYTDLLLANRDVVAKQVTENIYDRHLKPLFAAGKTA